MRTLLCFLTSLFFISATLSYAAPVTAPAAQPQQDYTQCMIMSSAVKNNVTFTNTCGTRLVLTTCLSDGHGSRQSGSMQIGSGRHFSLYVPSTKQLTWAADPSKAITPDACVLK